MKANKEDLIIEVFKEKGVYKGKIKWSKDNSKPVGYLILDQLVYNSEDHVWEDGTLYDPKSGRKYDASVSLQTDGTIEVTGQVLFFKSSRTFKRVK